MREIEARKNGVCEMCYATEACLPSKEIMKDMKAAGYKFYQDGKLYKPEANKKKTVQN